MAKRDLFEKWDKRGTWKEDRAWGCYVGWEMVCTQANPNAWKKDTEPCIAEPFNKNNHMGVCALRLFRITGEEKYRDRAFKIFAYTKSRFQLVDEAIQLLRMELLGTVRPRERGPGEEGHAAVDERSRRPALQRRRGRADGRGL